MYRCERERVDPDEYLDTKTDSSIPADDAESRLNGMTNRINAPPVFKLLKSGGATDASSARGGIKNGILAGENWTVPDEKLHSSRPVEEKTPPSERDTRYLEFAAVIGSIALFVTGIGVYKSNGEMAAEPRTLSKSLKCG